MHEKNLEKQNLFQSKTFQKLLENNSEWGKYIPLEKSLKLKLRRGLSSFCLDSKPPRQHKMKNNAATTNVTTAVTTQAIIIVLLLSFPLCLGSTLVGLVLSGRLFVEGSGEGKDAGLCNEAGLKRGKKEVGEGAGAIDRPKFGAGAIAML